MKKFVTVLLSALMAVMVQSPFFAAEAEAFSPQWIASQAYILLDVNDDSVALEHNAEAQMLPASTTKIMTIALALELTGQTKEEMQQRSYAVSSAAADIPERSTMAWLSEGEQVSMWDMLMAAETISANDAANALAEMAGGSIPDFVAKMNDKAAALGCTGTHFANPHGCNEDGHYTTAHDLALITKWALTVPYFTEVFGTEHYDMERTNMCCARSFDTKNEMSGSGAYAYDGIIGGKSGWTHASQYTLVEAAQRGGKIMIAVVMQCAGKQQKFLDEKALLDYGFATAESGAAV